MRIMLDVPNRKEFGQDIDFCVGVLMMLKADQSFHEQHEYMESVIMRLEGVILQLEEDNQYEGNHHG